MRLTAKRSARECTIRQSRRRWRAALPALLLLALLPRPATAQAGERDDAAAARRGQQLLARYHCGSCHVIPGVPGANGRLAIPLDLYGKRSYIAGRIANQPGSLALWIRDPQAVVPGTLMPDMGVTEADAHDIAAYLGQLK